MHIPIQIHPSLQILLFLKYFDNMILNSELNNSNMSTLINTICNEKQEFQIYKGFKAKFLFSFELPMYWIIIF